MYYTHSSMAYGSAFFIDVYPYGIILRSLLRLHITQLSTQSLYLVYLEYRYPIREDDEED